MSGIAVAVGRDEECPSWRPWRQNNNVRRFPMRDGCHHDFIRDAAFADSLTNNRVVYFLRALAPALQEFVYVIFAPPDGYQGSRHLGTALLESTDISMLQCAASSFN